MGQGFRRLRRRVLGMAVEPLETRALLSDLLGSFFAAPASATPGSTIDVNYQVDNNGGPDTPSFRVNFYLSANSTIGGTDFLLGGDDRTLSADTNTGHVTKSLTLPAANDPFWATGSGGSYFLGMLVDFNGTVTESDENNNANIGDGVDSKSIAVLPDLFGDFFDAAPSSAVPGSTFNVSYQLHNGGTGPTAQFHTNFYLSSDATITGSDIKLGNGVDTTLGSGATTGHLIQSVTLPALSDSFWSSVTTGTYYIGMITDSGSTVAESNESNNSSRGAGQDLDSVILPIDLVGDFFDVNSAAQQGSNVTVTYQIANTGSGVPGTFHVNFYFSNNSTITDTDTVLGPGFDVTLGANANTGHLTQSLTLPSPKANGSYWIGMIIDSNNIVVETNETNNASRGDGLDRDGIVVDNTAPSAALTPVTPPTAGATASFIVTYTDNNLVKASTIGSTDIRVTGPNSYSQLATPVGSFSQDANSITVTYNIPAPDGGWDLTDNGTYNISLVSGEVKDTANTPVAAGSLGTFAVNIPVSPPSITALTAGPDPVTRPGNLTLIATNVLGGASSLSKVEFYRDINQNGVLDVGIDTLLGSDTDAAGGWSLTLSSLGFALGSNANRFFARAQNTDGFFSNVVSATVTATNKAPTIETLSAAPSPVTRGTNITLTANNTVDADGSITEVKFYRDSNNNGTLDIGTDELLGTDTDSAGGWTVTTSSLTFDVANLNRFFAVAKDNDAAESNIAQTTLTANNANPTIGSFTASPSPVPRSGQVTLTASNVSDADGTIAKVEFYRDVNGNGQLDLTGTTLDILLGSGTNSSGTWTLAGPATSFPIGTVSFLARAQDNLGGFSIATASILVEPLSISPATVTRGQNITLTANGVSNATTKVDFYRDSNGNGVLDTDIDTLLGSDTSATGGWTWTTSTATFSAGENQFFSRAEDDQHVVTVATIKGTVNNIVPTIASVSDSPDPVVHGNTITLTANTVADTDGTITKVEFYRDSNDNGVFDAATDALLGSADTDGSDGWTFTGSSSSFKIGVNKFFARATDNDNGVSNAVSTTLTTLIANPVIESLSGPTDPIVRGQNIVLTANNVSDADGSISKVEFYRDVNGNGTLEVGTDILLGNGTKTDNDWTLTAPSVAFKIGTNRFFARATDNDGGVSNVPSATLAASNANPAIESLSGSPNPVLRSQNITLTANNVTDADGTISKVEFFRDGNGNGTLEPGDFLLGSDTSSAGGWTFSGSAAAFPFGVNKFFARATDNDGGTSTIAIASATVEPLSISATTVVRGQNITLTANAVPNGTAKVEFYRDSNNNGVLDIDTDTPLGSDTDGANGWTLSNQSTAGFSAGTNRYFSRALDDQNAAIGTTATITGTVTNVVPTIASLSSDATGTVTRGANVTLTANTVADSDGTIASVQFYRDFNNNGVLDLGADTLLGSDTDSAGGWTFTGSSAAFAIGSNRFFARAIDSDAAASTSVTTTLVTANAAPAIGSLSSAPEPLTRGQNITLTANNLSDVDGTIAKVEFYRDVNGNGQLDLTGTTPDVLLGSDTSSVNGWTFTGSSVSFPVGAVKFLARAQDNNLTWSGPATATSTVNNAVPTIETLTGTPNPVARNKIITLTANNVADADGPIKMVEFYLDVDGDGLLNLSGDTPDKKLGSDTSSTGGWTFSGSCATFPVGVNKFLARAQDDQGVWSALVTTTVTVTDAPPVIGSLTVQPSVLLPPGGPVVLSANGVVDDEAIIKVEFFRDVNNNGLLELTGDNPDLLIDLGEKSGDIWTLSFNMSGSPAGTYGFLARAKDNNVNNNGYSNVAKVSVTIANPCPIGGSLFNDLNGNGVKNTGEKGLQGWRVYIDENNNKKRDAGERSVLTDSKGHWSLSPAHFGTNRIRYVVPKGWKATTPSTLTFKLSSASCLAAQLFGVKKIV